MACFRIGGICSAESGVMHAAHISFQKQPGRSPLRVGFVPTIDCAVLIAAQELRLFHKHGVEVKLCREIGWATIREKLLHEELEAVHAHASMAFSIHCGMGVVARPCLTGLVLGLNGSAITLSKELWDRGVRDAASLGRLIRKEKNSRVFTFGTVLDLSSQNYNLQKWLRSGGIDVAGDVRIMIIPSSLIHESLRQGHLDGYCVAEPWNSAVTLDGTGWIAATAAEIEPRHPEKILLVLQEFAERREEEHLRMLSALIEASMFCDTPEHRPELVRMLAQSKYLDIEPGVLKNALVGPLATGHGPCPVDEFIIYHRGQANVPDEAKGKWAFDMIQSLQPGGEHPTFRREVIGKIFREDIYRKAVRRCEGIPQSESRALPVPAPEASPKTPFPASRQSGFLKPHRVATVLAL